MPIGGYFSLELRKGNAIPAWYERAIGFMSARSALAAQLQSMNCERAYVPTYNCESVLQALNSINVSVAHYKLNANGDIPHTVLPAQNEVVLINNYFGLFDAQTQRGAKRCDRRFVKRDDLRYIIWMVFLRHLLLPYN